MAGNREAIKEARKESHQLVKSNTHHLGLWDFADVENLVFEGGGVRGFAYLGALSELFGIDDDSINEDYSISSDDEDNDESIFPPRQYIDPKSIKRLAGASAGAITAFMLNLHYNDPKEAIRIVKNKPFVELLDPLDDTGEQRDAVLLLINLLKSFKQSDEKKPDNSPPELTMRDFVGYVFIEMLLELGVLILSNGIKKSLEKALKNGGAELLHFLINQLGFIGQAAAVIVKGILYGLNKLGFSNIAEHFSKMAGAVLDKIVSDIAAFFDIKDNFEKAIRKIASECNAGYRKVTAYLADNFGDDTLNDFKSHVINLMIKLMPGFMPDSFIERLPLALKKKLSGLPRSYGIFNGDTFLVFLEQQLENQFIKKDITFFELRKKTGKELAIMALDLTTGYTKVFSYKTTPNFLVVDAVRVSMSIPFFFDLHRVRFKNGENALCYDPHVYVDGGVLDNFPVWVFDTRDYSISARWAGRSKPGKNSKTLGLKLVTQFEKDMFDSLDLGEEIDSVSNRDILLRTGLEFETDGSLKTTIFGIAFTLLHDFYNQQSVEHYYSLDSFRTVYIDTGDVSMIDFDLAKLDKDKLIKAGKTAVTDYVIRMVRREARGDLPPFRSLVFPPLWRVGAFASANIAVKYGTPFLGSNMVMGEYLHYMPTPIGSGVFLFLDWILRAASTNKYSLLYTDHTTVMGSLKPVLAGVLSSVISDAAYHSYIQGISPTTLISTAWNTSTSKEIGCYAAGYIAPFALPFFVDFVIRKLSSHAPFLTYSRPHELILDQTDVCRTKVCDFYNTKLSDLDTGAGPGPGR